MRVTALLFLFVAALPFSCGTDSDATVGLASGCILTSECNPGLVCTFRRCHEECKTSIDCPRTGRCVEVGEHNVCVLPEDDAECAEKATCRMPLVCAIDDRCRNDCAAAKDCISGQVCATTGVCADQGEVDDAGNLRGTGPATGGAGGGGNEGGAGGSTMGGTSGAGNSSASGGEAGAVDENCARPLPGGGCNYCPVDACNHGDCVSADGDYSCECSPGYSGTGSKRCTLTDSCEAFLGCAPAYACVATEMPGGYACQGQFATWPMPDEGGAVAPDYSGTTEIVLDNVTGLTWERAGQDDCATTSGGAPVPCTREAAEDYCEALTLGTKSDFRVPTLIELQSLLDCTRSVVPLIDTTAFPTTPGYRYWASSPRASDGGGWVVDFTNCLPYPTDPASPLAVRCVSGSGIEPDLPVDHYTVGTGDPETVLDNWTGLTWIRAVGPDLLSLADAEIACGDFGTGFRVPTYKELLTLVDPARYNFAIDPSVFPGATAAEVWSSTGGVGSVGGFYAVVFTEGTAGWHDATQLHAVRCVKPAP